MYITLILCFASLVDFLLAVWIFGFTNHFIAFFYEERVEYNRPLLWRTGVFWLTFGLLQAIAALTWNFYPGMLLLITGVRLTESLADWTYLFSETNFTRIGKFGFFLSVPYTLIIAVLLYRHSLTMAPSELILPFWTYIPNWRMINSSLSLILLLLFLSDFIWGIIAIRFNDWLPGNPVTGSGTASLVVRTGGIWLGSSMIQLIAFCLWTQNPLWLLVVGGIRLTEVTTGWIWLWSLANSTMISKIFLFMSPLFNVVLTTILFGKFFSIVI